MKFNRLRYRNLKKAPLLASFFIMLTIPLMVWVLLTNPSFDPTSDASEEETPVCYIQFLYVNPNSLEAGATTQLSINANIDDEEDSIKRAEVKSDEQIIFENTYEKEGLQEISEPFSFTAEEKEEISLLGTLQTEKNVYPCRVLNTRGDSLSVLADNSAPQFLSDPYQDATPNNLLRLEDTYKYQLRAEDQNGDNIRFAYSFTPTASWLKMSVVEDGSSGSLVLDLSGSPDNYGSYLANVFIHDGYNTHLRSQSWVISVEPTENDIPEVGILTPSSPTSITQGDLLEIEWKGTDRNQITTYKVYIASNPGNENTWITLDDNLAHTYGRYLLNTEDIIPGTYKVIVQAVDNQDPPAVGSAISPEINISQRPEDITDGGTDGGDDGPDDGPVIEDPQITNITPSDDSEITNERPSISATLISGGDKTVNTDNIVFTFNNNDLSDQIEIATITDQKVSVSYTPENDLEVGSHKVMIEFEDSEGDQTSREWTFSLVSEEDDSETFSIFGYDLSKRTAYIIGAGIVILLLALMIPWLLYLAWREDEDEYGVYPQQYPPSGTRTNRDYRSSTEKTRTTTRSKENEPQLTSRQESKDDVYTPKLHTDDTTKVQSKDKMIESSTSSSRSDTTQTTSKAVQKDKGPQRSQYDPMITPVKSQTKSKEVNKSEKNDEIKKPQSREKEKKDSGIEYPPDAPYQDFAKPEKQKKSDSSELNKLAASLKKKEDRRTKKFSEKPAKPELRQQAESKSEATESSKATNYKKRTPLKKIPNTVKDSSASQEVKPAVQKTGNKKETPKVTQVDSTKSNSTTDNHDSKDRPSVKPNQSPKKGNNSNINAGKVYTPKLKPKKNPPKTDTPPETPENSTQSGTGNKPKVEFNAPAPQQKQKGQGNSSKQKN